MTRQFVRFGFTVLVVGLLVACQQYALVPAQKPYQIGKAFHATPTSDWSVKGSGDVQQWTIDGLQLQQIMFSVDAGHGEPVLRISGPDGQPKKNLATFEEDSSPLDLVDALKTSLEAAGYDQVAIDKIDVETIEDKPTIRLEVSASADNSPKYQGIAFIIQDGDQIHSAIFLGTALYHFEKNKAEFVNMMHSLSWIAKA